MSEFIIWHSKEENLYFNNSAVELMQDTVSFFCVGDLLLFAPTAFYKHSRRSSFCLTEFVAVHSDPAPQTHLTCPQWCLIGAAPVKEQALIGFSLPPSGCPQKESPWDFCLSRPFVQLLDLFVPQLFHFP